MTRLSFYDNLEFFNADEFEHPEMMDMGFLQRLDRVRRKAGVPFVITSDYRDPKPGDKPSAHHFGKAVDIRCSDSQTRFAIILGAIREDIRRIGIYDKHIHLDDAIVEEGFPARVAWLGTSR